MPRRGATAASAAFMAELARYPTVHQWFPYSTIWYTREGETWYGPFASHLCGYPSLESFHPDDMVFAVRSLRYGERYGTWLRSAGELFALEGLFNDEVLLEQGMIKRANPRGQRLLHEATERVWVDAITQADYARRYHDGDLSSIVATQTEAPPGVVEPQRGRPRTAEWRQWSLEDIVQLLRDARGSIRHTNLHPKISEIIAATGFPRETIRKGLKRHGHTPTTILPLLDD